ncbi:hypothetical protein [Flavobacterium tructae]|uniref:hypothetical protein n=1 Tax=Flavobacterium tructae TaxID=1114873 RepID=UPI0035A84628
MNEFKKIYNTIKDNITMIALIPTILGGILQIFFLATMSWNLIRFFSISQLISDGILVMIFLYPISFFFLVFRNPAIFINKSYLRENSPSIRRLIYSSFICVVIIDIIILFDFNKIIQLLDWFSLHKLIILIMTIGGIILNFLSDTMKVLKQIISIVVVVLSSLTIIIAFSNTYKNTNKIENYTILIQKVKNEQKTARMPEILYFNDKYIFIGIEKSQQKSIVIKKLDDLFEH